MKIKTKTFVLALILSLSLIIELTISWQSIPTLLEKIVLDDAF